jgi:tetratricopeptide (TPR) repeat protein
VDQHGRCNSHDHDKGFQVDVSYQVQSRNARPAGISAFASTYSALGQNDKALALKEKVLAARTAKLGADHPDTLTSMNNLAATYFYLGQYDKALALHEKSLAGRRARLGAEHPDTIGSMENVLITCRKVKRYDKAYPLLLQVIPAKVAREGESNNQAQLLMGMLLLTEESLGKSSGLLQRYSPQTQAAAKANAAALRRTGD